MNRVTDAGALGLASTAALPAEAFARLERDVVFDGAKWDVQVGDVATLAPYALTLSADVWAGLARDAEALWAEVAVAETALLHSVGAARALGLPRALGRALRARAPSPALGRFVRFDFHPTDEGWRVSEVNSDVPGGFSEASIFTARMADATGAGSPCGDPLGALVDHVVARAPADGDAAFALVHATAWADDRQVAEVLRRALLRCGVDALPVAPDHLRWSTDGTATVALAGIAERPVWGLWRFFPAEWLPNLPACGWERLVTGGAVPALNPGTAALLQSKRWPLVVPPGPVWSRHAPETAEVTAHTRAHVDWVLKPALGRIGEGVVIDGVTKPALARSARRWAWWSPRAWVAQRRFRSVAVDTPDGPRHAAVGVYVLDGRAIGVYARVAPAPLVDGHAREVAVLVTGRTA